MARVGVEWGRNLIQARPTELSHLNLDHHQTPVMGPMQSISSSVKRVNDRQLVSKYLESTKEGVVTRKVYGFT